MHHALLVLIIAWVAQKEEFLYHLVIVIQNIMFLLFQQQKNVPRLFAQTNVPLAYQFQVIVWHVQVCLIIHLIVSVQMDIMN